jgi:hypothetical protein
VATRNQGFQADLPQFYEHSRYCRLIATAIITYIDKLSETPDKGE